MKNKRNIRKKVTSPFRLSISSTWTGSKKIRKKRSRRSKFLATSKHLVPWIAWWTVICLLVILGVVAYNKRFNNPEFDIQDVLIEEESILTYDNQDIFSALKEGIIWKNYRGFMLSGKNTLIQTLQQEYPLISSIDIFPTERETLLYANILFHPPLIQFKNNLSSRVIWENRAYKVRSSDTIQEWTISISLPSYTDQYETLDWIFYKIHSKTLESIITNISDIIPIEEIEEIEYDPGGQKLHLTFQWKTILFHLDKSIDWQLVKLLDIKQYYKEYDAISKMDLWSSDHIIVK